MFSSGHPGITAIVWDLRPAGSFYSFTICIRYYCYYESGLLLLLKSTELSVCFVKWNRQTQACWVAHTALWVGFSSADNSLCCKMRHPVYIRRVFCLRLVLQRCWVELDLINSTVSKVCRWSQTAGFTELALRLYRTVLKLSPVACFRILLLF